MFEEKDLKFLTIPTAPTSKFTKEALPTYDIRHPAEAYFSNGWITDDRWLGYRLHNKHPKPDDLPHLALSVSTLQAIARDEQLVLRGLGYLAGIVGDENILGVAPLPAPHEMYYVPTDVVVYPVRVGNNVRREPLPKPQVQHVKTGLPREAYDTLFREDLVEPAYVALRRAYTCFAGLRRKYFNSSMLLELMSLCENIYFNGMWLGHEPRTNKWILYLGTYPKGDYGRDTRLEVLADVTEDAVYG